MIRRNFLLTSLSALLAPLVKWGSAFPWCEATAVPNYLICCDVFVPGPECMAMLIGYGDDTQVVYSGPIADFPTDYSFDYDVRGKPLPYTVHGQFKTAAKPQGEAV